MFIKSLRLSNFRSFEHVEIDFEEEKSNRKRTLFLGENGTGKSNILKAIALVTAGSNALGELLGDPELWIRFGQKQCRIEAILTTQKKEERHIWLEFHRGDSLRDVMSRCTDSLEEIDQALSHADRNYFMVAYGASRIMSKGGSRSKRQSYYSSIRSQCVSSLLDKEAGLQSIEDWAIDLDYRDSKQGLNIIRKVFDDFLPGIKFKSIDKNKRQLILQTPDGDVPLEALSDGYQNMASWIGDLLFRVNSIFKDRKDPLKASGVLLLDEIDLHLHPKWQRKLLSFISETLPNMQLIATTHSPFTAQQAKAGELFIIQRINDKLSIEVFPGDPSKMLLHQLIMSDVFDLETDESIYVESLKKEHEVLSKNINLASKSKSRLKEVETELNSIPTASYSNSLISEDERQTMKDLLKKLNKKGHASS